MMFLKTITFIWLVLFLIYNGGVAVMSIGFYVYCKDEPSSLKYIGLVCAAYAILMLIFTFVMMIR